MGALESKHGSSSGEAAIKALVANSTPIVVFSSSSCGYCTQAVRLLKDSGYSSQLTVINATSGQRFALKSLTGISSVPSIWLRGIYVGGLNDGARPWHGLIPLIRSGDFQKILDGQNPYL